jgi:aryl-alcohol dehydrogenase-like predicted oxidoreductase
VSATRDLGRTGLTVSALGLGAIQVGDPALTEADAARVLHAALDAGVRLIDTARAYGLSEERIGRHLATRRNEFVLSTKVGYGVPGRADWTWDCIVEGVEAARTRLASEVIDIVHLHSCPLETLQRGEVIDALLHCVARGLVRAAAYSGDGPALDYALECGAFAVLQPSLNLCDQAARPVIAEAATRGIGVLVKRPLAGRPWAVASRPDADDAERDYRERFSRWRAAAGLEPTDWETLSLRFAAWEPGVTCCLVGGRNPAHLVDNLRRVGEGPLPADDRRRVIDAWQAHRQDWPGRI